MSSEGTGFIVGKELARVKEQTYELAFQHYETVKLFGGRAPKLALWFRIVSQGEHFGEVLPRYYNVRSIKGKPQRNGDFTITRGSSFVREFCLLFGAPSRLDRIPMTRFKNVIIEGKTRTVKSGINNIELAEQLQYSVIDKLCRVKEL